MSVLKAVLTKLRDKAYQVYGQFRGGSTPPSVNLRHDNDVDCADELAIFGGQTRVLFSKILTSKSPNWDHKKPTAIRSSSAEPLSLSIVDKLDPNNPTQPVQTKMEDIHPSLMEYMALFPPSAFAPDFNAYPDINSEPPAIGQSPLNVPVFPQYDTPTDLSNYSYPSLPLPYLSFQQPQGPVHTQSQAERFPNMAPIPPSSSTAPGPFIYEPSSTLSFDTFQNAQTYPTSASTPESMGSSDHITDLGMMVNGDSGMDEQWMSFMRESGILERQGEGLGAAGI
jgi:hypothetical protein